ATRLSWWCATMLSDLRRRVADIAIRHVSYPRCRRSPCLTGCVPIASCTQAAALDIAPMRSPAASSDHPSFQGGPLLASRIGALGAPDYFAAGPKGSPTGCARRTRLRLVRTDSKYPCPG